MTKADPAANVSETKPVTPAEDPAKGESKDTPVDATKPTDPAESESSQNTQRLPIPGDPSPAPEEPVEDSDIFEWAESVGYNDLDKNDLPDDVKSAYRANHRSL